MAQITPHANLDELRLYSFVAGLYLSPLQCGLQTAHAVAEMSLGGDKKVFEKWARDNKTIIICNALNSKGVVELYAKLRDLAPHWYLPVALFREDDDSLNNAATATAVIVPKKYFAAEFVAPNPHSPKGSVAAGERYVYRDDGSETQYVEGNPEFEFIKLIKSYRLV